MANTMRTLVLKTNPESPDPQVILQGAQAIRRGELVAFPTETVYGLGADAFNERAVERVFEVKGRPKNNPLPVQIASVEDVSSLAVEISDVAKRLMEHFWPGPLTLVLRASPRVSKLITAGTGNIGVRISNHPVALALIKEAGTPIVAPSANTSGEPPQTTAEQVLTYLEGKIELVIDAGPTEIQVSSTVLDVTETPPRVIRAGSITWEMLLPYIA